MDFGSISKDDVRMRTPPSAAPIHADADCLQAKFTVRSDATTADGGTEEFGKQVAMHIAAANPASLSEADLDPAVVEKERQVQIDIAKESGKPDAVIEKMIVGRMKKFLGEVTLLGQQFVINPDLTVEKAAEEAGATIVGFVRMQVGEGIEKEKEDFAAEVAKAAQG